MSRTTVYSLVLYLSCAFSLWAAPSFTNLDFESADVNDLPSNTFEFISVTDGLPGWSAYIGTNQLTLVGHNAITLGSPNVGIAGPQYGNGILQLEGTYAAMLQAFSDGIFLPASIAQTGLIPASAKSLRFEAVRGTNALSVTVGGTNILMISLGPNLFGCDVSAFANSIEELRFTEDTTHGGGLSFLDAITFSPDAIPEPSTLALTAAALMLLFGVRARRFLN